MGDSTLYDTTTPSVGTLAMAHQRIVRMRFGGVWVNITGDINNFSGAPAAIKIPREAYGTKARTSSQNAGYNFAPTFTVEAVRDPATNMYVPAQAWLVDLINAGASEGAENLREFQWFDAFDERLPAYEGTFSVAVSDANTAYADKGVYSIALENDGVVDKITSPIAGDGSPVIESVGPTLQTVGEQLVIRGYFFTGTTSISVDGVEVGTATEDFTVVDDNTIVLTIPAAVTGASPVIVTNAAGASDAFAYVAATV